MNWTKAAIDQDSVIFSDGIVAFIMKGVPNMDFMIGETPVTQALWTSIMGTNPSEGPTDPYLPVCNVSYPMVKEFIGRTAMIDFIEVRAVPPSRLCGRAF